MKPVLALFLCGVCLTCAVRSGQPETVDELLPLYASVSFLDHGDFDIPVRDTFYPGFYVEGADGRYYQKFGPGQAFVLAPFAAIGRAVTGADASPAVRGRNILQSALFFGMFVVPLTAVVFFLFCVDLGYSEKTSALAALSIMAATELLPYSRTLFGDLTCAFLGLSAFFLIATLKPDSTARAAAAGLCVGLSILVRPVSVLFAPAFVLCLILIWKRESFPIPVCRRHLMAAVVPAALLGSALLAYNRHAFGSFFSSGYGSEMFQFDEPLWRGAWHLLFSFEKGFFIYSPVVLLSLLFWRHFHRAHPQVSLAILVYAGLYLIVYSGWYASSPGKELSYGQRFLLPVVPVALLALPECLSRLRRNVWSIAAVLVLWVSFLVQAAGCLQTGLAYRNWAAQFESEPSPLVGYVLLTVRDPATIRVWWWQSGALGRSAGVALVCLAVYFAVLSVRRNRAAG